MRVVPATIGAIGLSVLLAAPGYAQQAPAPGVSQPPATTQPANSGPNGSLEKYNGKWRADKLVGASVYNEQGQSIGSIDDLLVGDDGRINTVVLSVGGFLGIGGKLVAVPFDQFKFEPSRGTVATATTNGATGTAAPASGSTTAYYSIVLPAATKTSLTNAVEFKYSS